MAEQRGRYSLRAITRPARGTSLSRWWDYRVDVRPRHYRPGVLLTELGRPRWDSRAGLTGRLKPWTFPDGPTLGIRIVGALLPKAPWRECGHLSPPATFLAVYIGTHVTGRLSRRSPWLRERGFASPHRLAKASPPCGKMQDQGESNVTRRYHLPWINFKSIVYWKEACRPADKSLTLVNRRGLLEFAFINSRVSLSETMHALAFSRLIDRSNSGSTFERYREAFKIFAGEGKQREYLALPLRKWSMPLSRMNAIPTIFPPLYFVTSDRFFSRYLNAQFRRRRNWFLSFFFVCVLTTATGGYSERLNRRNATFETGTGREKVNLWKGKINLIRLELGWS